MSEWVWGIDPATSHVAFAFAGVDHDEVETETLVTSTESFAAEGQRLGWLDRQVRIYVSQVAKRYPPACVWVERPTGARDKTPYILVQASGVIIAAVYEALGGVPTFEIPVSTWKRDIVGNGNASKAAVAQWVAQHIPVESQDEADAYCIALAGRGLLEQSRRSVAA